MAFHAFRGGACLEKNSYNRPDMSNTQATHDLHMGLQFLEGANLFDKFVVLPAGP